MSLIAENLIIDKTLPINFSISHNDLYILKGQNSGLIFSYLSGKLMAYGVKGKLTFNNIDILKLNAELLHYYRNLIFIFNTRLILNKIEQRIDDYISEVISIVKRKKIKSVLIDLSNIDKVLRQKLLYKFSKYKKDCIFVIYEKNEDGPFSFEVVQDESLQNQDSFNDVTTRKPEIMVSKEIKDEDNKNGTPSWQVDNPPTNKKSETSYLTLVKRYYIHYIFVLIFSVCSSLGWFFFGFYKSPYNYYKGFEANMTAEQIADRVAKGEAVSADFLWGWVISLIISIILTLICCYGIITFRKTIRSSKHFDKEYDKKTQFSMFVIIMLFALFLTGVGIMIFYALNTKLMGFYYGNVDIFFTLLIAILIETMLIFIPFKVLTPKEWNLFKRNTNKKQRR